MKPFLLLATRADDMAADGEYRGVLTYGRLEPAQLHRVRLEQAPAPPIDLDDYSGIILGGSPFNASAPEPTPLQQRVESELHAILERALARDFPFLGACYGIGIIGTHLGATVDATFAEAPGSVPIALTDDGHRDPLTAGLPETFHAIVGHKEALRALPVGATLLATGAACPVQMFRVGEHVYATQFHPELDPEELGARLRVYANEGYCDPAEADSLVAQAASTDLSAAHEVLRRFVERYQR